TPDANYFGTDSFTYSLSDGVASSTAFVSLDITPVNDVPVANADSFSGAEDADITGNVITNDTDVEGPLSATVTAGPTHGALVFNSDGSFTYTPDANYFGTDSFTYSLSDGVAASTALVSLDITPVNDVPIANADTYSGAEDTDITGNVIANDSDVEGPLSATVDVGPAHGAVVLNLDGSFTYTPNANYNGADSFTYILSDGVATSIATVSLDITPVNDAPVAADDSYAGLEDNSIAGNVLSNDSDIDSATLTASLITGPIHGTVALSANGDFTYTPVANFFGTDSFTYSVTDAGGATDVASVTITVTSVNDAPTFNLGPDITAGAGAQIVDPFATGMSPGPANESGQPLNWDIVNDNPALFSSQPTLDASGKLSFTPADQANGIVAVHVTLVDGGGTANGGVDRSTQTFLISLNALNQNTIGQFIIAPASESVIIDDNYIESPDYVEDDLVINPAGFYGVGGDNQMTSTGEMIGFDSLDYYNSSLAHDLITDLPANSTNLSSTDFFQINEVLDSARDMLGFPIESTEFNMLIDHPNQDPQDLVNKDFNGSLQAMLDLMNDVA
ncbi:MAG: tandem-95 repeat protein, partial [Chlamydiales bacterium]|nr:tandem-95 repeat protein [Chlamydiales bacterium]